MNNRSSNTDSNSNNNSNVITIVNHDCSST